MKRRITGRNLIWLFTQADYKDIDKVTIYINSKFVFAFNPTVCKVIDIDQMLDNLAFPMYVDHIFFWNNKLDVHIYILMGMNIQNLEMRFRFKM